MRGSCQVLSKYYLLLLILSYYSQQHCGTVLLIIELKISNKYLQDNSSKKKFKVLMTTKVFFLLCTAMFY